MWKRKDIDVDDSEKKKINVNLKNLNQWLITKKKKSNKFDSLSIYVEGENENTRVEPGFVNTDGEGNLYFLYQYYSRHGKYKYSPFEAKVVKFNIFGDLMAEFNIEIDDCSKYVSENLLKISETGEVFQLYSKNDGVYVSKWMLVK